MKKKIIYLSAILVLVISLITLSCIYKSKDNKYKKEYNTISKGMAIMIKEKGATDYVQSNSKDIPKGNYVLNEEKTHCENNGKVTNYDSATGKISLNFVGSDKCYLYFDYEVPPRIGYEAILLDNGGGATTVDAAKAYIEGRTTSTTPNFATTATTNEGMYAADDDYTATTGMKSYYFRGAVDNNWVKFGKYTKDMYNCNDDISFTDTGNSCTKIASNGDDIYWRIIRINGDGSIRMIYSGVTPPTESTKVIKTTDTSLGNSSSTYYSETEINDWYKTTTLETDSATKILVADKIFCADKTTSSPSTSSPQTPVFRAPAQFLYYGAKVRLNSNKPILTCPTASDKFTVGTSNGNGALTYPVGLITADEIVMAGGGAENSSYYLYTSQNYWSYSPAYTMGDGYYYFYVDSSGDFQSHSISGYYGARPVISLSSKTKLSGSGTYNDIYTVVGGNSTEDTSSGKSFDTVFATNNTDIFPENGLRYEGADPNNYICLDSNKEGACSSSLLLFRIIGLFDEEYSANGTTSSGTKKLLKILDTNNYGGTSGKYWNQTQTSGKNYNDWSTATLKTELNDLYLRTLLDTSGVNSKLNDAIVTSKWHLGGANATSSSIYYTQKITTENYYKAERSPYATSGTLQNLYSGNPEYVFAKVGLMYPSDYGYATVGGSTTSKTNCRTTKLYSWDSSSFSDCKNNDWLFKSQSSFVNNAEWLISPNASYSSSAAYLNSSGSVSPYGSNSVANGKFAVRPTFYLDSSVLKIVGTGDGTKDNAYRIG